MSAQTQQLQQASLLTGRQMVMLATIALHAMVIGALMTARYVAQVEHPVIAIVATFDPVEKPEMVKPPEMPDPVMKVAKAVLPDIPIPDMNLDNLESVVVPTGPVATDAVADSIAEPATEGTGVADVPLIASTALQYRAVRSADDYYPAASLRLQEAGTSIVQVCVAPSGKMEGAPTIQQSSGSPRLDAAAVLWAREALRFTPATRGGVAVSACKGFRVNFKLH